LRCSKPLKKTKLYFSIRQSSWFNVTVVSIKLVVILLFIFGLAGFMHTPNYHPYVPENKGDWHYFGTPGIFAAATTVFFR
jgi:APA family basic amino acid/polyamine antiporter